MDVVFAIDVTDVVGGVVLVLFLLLLPVYYAIRGLLTGKDITKKPPAKWKD